MKIGNTIYKRNTNGSIQQWEIEVENNKFRTHEGVLEKKDGSVGKITTSKWKEAMAKNVGRANSTTAEEQAILEAERRYIEQIHKGYRENIEDIDVSVYFKPMLASKYDKKTKLEWPVYVQPKLDGTRCIVRKDGMWSRNGKPIISAPHIFNALKHVFETYPDAVFDGELYNHELKNNFERIISLTRKSKPTEQDLKDSANMIQYHVYDMILSTEYAESNLKERFLTKFNELNIENSIVPVQTSKIGSKESLDEIYSEYLENGYEGQIIRFYNSPYENKRSKYLLKRKEFLDEEFEIVDVIEGVGNRGNMAGKVRVKNHDGSEFNAGIKGGEKLYIKMLKDSGKLIGKYATIRYQNLSEYGVPRFPVCIGIRDYE